MRGWGLGFGVLAREARDAFYILFFRHGSGSWELGAGHEHTRLWWYVVVSLRLAPAPDRFRPKRSRQWLLWGLIGDDDDVGRTLCSQVATTLGAWLGV